MLATQDVCDIEVPDEDTRSRGEQLIERARFLSMDQLMFAKEVAEFAATEEYQEWGDTTSIDWIRLHCHMTGPQAANYVAAGEHFDDLPQTVLAMAEGKVGFGHIVAMARTAHALAASPTAKVFDEMQVEESEHRTSLIELFRKRFGTGRGQQMGRRVAVEPNDLVDGQAHLLRDLLCRRRVVGQDLSRHRSHAGHVLAPLRCMTRQPSLVRSATLHASAQRELGWSGRTNTQFTPSGESRSCS